MWHASQEDLECTHAHVSWLWRGAGPRSQRGAQYPARSAFVHSRRYRGAHGNRQACPVKRFWTGDLYHWTSDGQWQAPWMKEEPPAFAAEECQLSIHLIRFSLQNILARGLSESDRAGSQQEQDEHAGQDVHETLDVQHSHNTQ